MVKRFFCALSISLLSFGAFAQDKGVLNGDFQLNTSAYDYDAKIGTTTTQYLHEKSSAEAWLMLNYRYEGFTASVRYDMFHNSPLLIPTEAYSQQGIPFISLSKEFDKVSITIGSFYDQFGSGIVFRAFEDRVIGLDYAMQGARLKWTPNDSFMVKAFTGFQKNRFAYHPQNEKGVNAEKIWGWPKLSFVTGGAFLNRTLDQLTIDKLVDRINAMPLEQRFDPKYNMFAWSAYNTLRSGGFSLYTEYAQKTPEAVYIDDGTGNLFLKNKAGKVIYGVGSYSRPGFGLNLQYKKVETFIMRASPDDQFLVGIMNYLPPLSKQNAFRLPARYGISAQDQGEEGVQGEMTFSPKEHSTFSLSGSYIRRPDQTELYREYYLDWTRKFNRKIRTQFGIQYVEYNQKIYQGEPTATTVKALTPFMEFSLKVDRRMRKSIRGEFQYMSTRQDKGDFLFGLLEFNWAPHYSVSVSDMINIKPLVGDEKIHYYTIFGAYTYKQSRFTLGYIKQVAGVVCTGGVCRVEPAFSGARFGMTTNF